MLQINFVLRMMISHMTKLKLQKCNTFLINWKRSHDSVRMSIDENLMGGVIFRDCSGLNSTGNLI